MGIRTLAAVMAACVLFLAGVSVGASLTVETKEAATHFALSLVFEETPEEVPLDWVKVIPDASWPVVEPDAGVVEAGSRLQFALLEAAEAAAEEQEWAYTFGTLGLVDDQTEAGELEAVRAASDATVPAADVLELEEVHVAVRQHHHRHVVTVAPQGPAMRSYTDSEHRTITVARPVLPRVTVPSTQARAAIQPTMVVRSTPIPRYTTAEPFARPVRHSN